MIDPLGGRSIAAGRQSLGPDAGLVQHERIVEQGQRLGGDVGHVAAALHDAALGKLNASRNLGGSISVCLM